MDQEFANVRIVRRKGKAVLVEYEDEGQLRRRSIPFDYLSDYNESEKWALVESTVLDIGIPYGVRWAKQIKEVRLTPEKIEAALYKAGVWTAQDLLENPARALEAIRSAAGVDLNVLYRAAKLISKQEDE